MKGPRQVKGNTVASGVRGSALSVICTIGGGRAGIGILSSREMIKPHKASFNSLLSRCEPWALSLLLRDDLPDGLGPGCGDFLPIGSNSWR
ncbi:hypothetical protein EYF80_010171 [Liparis tanakae]|uniref:Uncharacterized protein n=1 Tax=Liparis tanakae TaxID=230148 RepID=A0A4Z2INI5_9TELE|nr:hypothetical protein EYF80_010171 [Liparis tanakae]